MKNKTGGYWWLVLVAQLVIALVGFILHLVMLEVDSYFATGADYLLVVWGVGLVIWLLSPIAIHLDRRYVARISSWEPSRDYYAVVIPLLGVFMGGLYLVKRYQYVGFS